MNWREHPFLALAGLGLIALALLVVSIRGCGCGRSRPVATADPGNVLTVGNKAKKVWLDDCPEPKDWGKEEPAKPPPPPPPPPSPSPPASRTEPEKTAAVVQKKAGRPTDVAEWTPGDFQSAKRDQDPRLIEAVAYFGKHFATKEAVGTLVTLLELPPVDPVADRSAQRVETSPALTEAVITALAANGDSSARQILERFVAGTQKTIDPQIAATAALRALLARYGREEEDLLFRVVTTPEQAAIMDRTAADPNKLRSAALEWVKSSASEAFRVRLAQHVATPETPHTIYNQIWASLSEPRAENVAAQIVLYESDRLAEIARKSLELQFAEQSRATLRRLLAFAPPRPIQSTPVAATSIERPYHTAELLWGTNFTAVVEQRLRLAQGPIRGTPLLSLACTVPCPAIRAALLQSLEKYWEEGPKGLDPFTASDESAVEPGFLLLIKQLPRKDAATAKPGNVASSRGESSRPTSARAAKFAAAREIKDRQNKVAQQWLTFSEHLVQAMCRQFSAAAFARRIALKGSGLDEDAADFPIKLPPNAVVAASYRADWPEGLDGAPAGLSLAPLRIRYVRIEQKARPDKLMAFYRRQLPSAEIHPNQYGVWFDAFNLDKKEGRTRSIDVFITKPNKDVAIYLEQEQQVILEILTIECLSQADH